MGFRIKISISIVNRRKVSSNSEETQIDYKGAVALRKLVQQLFSCKKYDSTRKIETACRCDINFMYLLEGAPAPDYSTIARFRSFHFAPVSEKIIVQMTEFLAQNGELSLENLFIDGTKIEAAANKYSFVWKKSVTKNQQKLLDKIPAFILKADDENYVYLEENNQLAFIKPSNYEISKTRYGIPSFLMQRKAKYTRRVHIVGNFT